MISCGDPLQFHAEGELQQIVMLPWLHPTAPEGKPGVILETGGERISVVLNRWPASADFLMPSIQLLATAPRQQRLIIAKAGLGSWIRLFESILNEPVELLNVALSETLEKHDDAVAFKLGSGAHLVLGAVFASRQFMHKLEHLLACWPIRPQSAPPLPSFFPRFEVGYSVVTTRELNTLACGDVILLEPTDFLHRRQLRMRVPPHLNIYLKLEKGRAMVEDIRQDNEFEETQGDPINIDELNVTLTFDVGSQQLSLSELKKLRKGYIFEVGRPLSQLVTIRANGQRIGTAELVEIDDRVGMRIVSLISH